MGWLPDTGGLRLTVGGRSGTASYPMIAGLAQYAPWLFTTQAEGPRSHNHTVFRVTTLGAASACLPPHLRCDVRRYVTFRVSFKSDVVRCGGHAQRDFARLPSQRRYLHA